MVCTKTLREMPRQKHLLFNLPLSVLQFITFIDLFTHFVLPILLAHADILYTFFIFITSDPLSHPHFCVEIVRGAKYWRFEQVTKAGEVPVLQEHGLGTKCRSVDPYLHTLISIKWYDGGLNKAQVKTGKTWPHRPDLL